MNVFAISQICFFSIYLDISFLSYGGIFDAIGILCNISMMLRNIVPNISKEFHKTFRAFRRKIKKSDEKGRHKPNQLHKAPSYSR